VILVTPSSAPVSPDESRGILDLLYAHISKPEHSSKPEHIVRHTWSEGDVVIWDNRITALYSNCDNSDFRRIMQRVPWTGDVPSGVAGPRSPGIGGPRAVNIRDHAGPYRVSDGA